MSRIKRIKNKFYDVGTSNKSFLQVAKDLKNLGIRNYYFMLEIYDYSLINVDPYADNLTQDQISRIMMECVKNPWYYLREVCRIPSQGGVPVRYKANRGNIAQAWCNLHGIDSWLCLPRQQGKTVSAIALYAWAYSFGTNDSQTIFVHKDSDGSKANLGRLKDQIDCLPEYLRFESLMIEDDNGKIKTVKAVKNATSLKHPITNNVVNTKSKATNYEAALSLARGLSCPLLYFDEPEFTNEIKTIIENSAPTFNTAARNAKQNNAIYSRCFTCTPGDLDTSPGEQSQKILADTATWTEKMYDMHYDKDDDKNEVLQYVYNNSRNNIVYIEYSYKQLGLSNEWFYNICREINNPITIKREILLQRIRGSSDSPFDQEDIEYIMNSTKSVIEELFILEYFKFDVYTPLNRNTPYIVGIDCSTGTNEDNNAITVIDPYTEEPVADFKCPYIGETKYEQLIMTLVKEHIPRAILCIERNSVGDGIIDHLLNSSIRQNLYYDKNKDLVEDNLKDSSTITSMLKKQADQKKFYGVYTGPQSREDMMAILFRRVAEFKDKFVTKNIADDIAHLVRTRSGKIEAGPGMHDDNIMSYLIGMYIFYHGNNLPMFGFIRGSEEIVSKADKEYTIDDVERLGILPERDIITMKQQEAVAKENDYDKLLQKAIAQAQTETRTLAEKGLIRNSVYENTPKEVLEESDYSSGDIDLSFFNELNGF